MRRSSLQLLPLVNLVKRLFSGTQKSLLEFASNVEEIQPAETGYYPRAIYTPGSLDRIVAVHPWTTLPLELAQIETSMNHAAVIRYEFENVLVHPLGLDLRDGARMRIRGGLLPKARSNRIKYLETATYCMTPAVSRYFGHWLRDGCATALLTPPGDPLILSANKGWDHSPCYLRAFNLEPERTDRLYVRRLVLFQDHGQGSSKQRRYEELRRRIRFAYPAEDDGPRKVYLRRGAGGRQRVLTSEGDLVDRLVTQGFDIVDVLRLSMEDLAYRLRSARIIVSMEGSHVNHAYFSAPDHAKVLLLIPADRVSLVHAGIARALGFGFGFCVISAEPGGYRVEINELLSTLETLENAPKPMTTCGPARQRPKPADQQRASEAEPRDEHVPGVRAGADAQAVCTSPVDLRDGGRRARTGRRT